MIRALVQEAIAALEEILTKAEFKAGEMLHRQHEVGNTIFLVKSGIIRSYYYVDGKDITAHFAMGYGIIGAVDSLLKGKKSLYNIEALEDSEVFLLKYAEMEAFLAERPQLERLARKVVECLYLDLVERMEGMTFLTAKDRYDHLLARYPRITQQVKLGHIASFLGITQETLSRVRGLK